MNKTNPHREWLRSLMAQLQRMAPGNDALVYAETTVNDKRADITYTRNQWGSADVARMQVEYIDGDHVVTAEHVAIVLPDRYWSPTAVWFQARMIEITSIRTRYAELTLETWSREECIRWMLRFPSGQCRAVTPKEVVHATDTVRLHFHIVRKLRLPMFTS